MTVYLRPNGVPVPSLYGPSQMINGLTTLRGEVQA